MFALLTKQCLQLAFRDFVVLNCSLKHSLLKKIHFSLQEWQTTNEETINMLQNSAQTPAKLALHQVCPNGNPFICICFKESLSMEKRKRKKKGQLVKRRIILNIWNPSIMKMKILFSKIIRIAYAQKTQTKTKWYISYKFFVCFICKRIGRKQIVQLILRPPKYLKPLTMIQNFDLLPQTHILCFDWYYQKKESYTNEYIRIRIEIGIISNIKS